MQPRVIVKHSLQGIDFACPDLMSRVEPEPEEPASRRADRRQELEKAEGDEETIDEALRRQEQPRPED